MRVVVALGGNALLRRGQPLTAENQRANARVACKALAPVALEHELVISHGNGPQVGLLALQGSAYTEVDPYPLDLLGAQTEGMIGYLIQQELGNELPLEKRLASLLTLIEVDRRRPRVRGSRRSRSGRSTTRSSPPRLAEEKGWLFKPDGDSFRRVVPSPLPQRIFGVEPVEWLLAHDCVVICAGGGGIPVMYTDEPVPAGRRLVGVEAVIDKDLASALLAQDLRADALLIVDRRRRRLLRLGHPGAASDPPRDSRSSGRDRVRCGLDGTEGPRRLRLRRADGRPGRDRLDLGHAGAASRRGRHDGDARRGRHRSRSRSLKEDLAEGMRSSMQPATEGDGSHGDDRTSSS